MISEFIVGLSMLMAAGFVLTYLLRPGWRRRIEAPKHSFQAQVEHFDSALTDSAGERGRQDENSRR